MKIHASMWKSVHTEVSTCSLAYHWCSIPSSLVPEDDEHYSSEYSRCHISDIFIPGSSNSEHLNSLEQVLKWLQHHGVRLKKSKCAFMKPSVEYVGHWIAAHGLHPTKDKLRAVLSTPTPRNVHSWDISWDSSTTMVILLLFLLPFSLLQTGCCRKIATIVNFMQICW